FKLVLTLRADFVAAGLEIPKLAEILQRSSILVPPCLSDEDYRQVIVRPAEQVGLKVESGLVEVLLQELDKTPGDLPLLEFVLEQLWQKRKTGELTLKSYQSEIGGLQGALEQKAQATYDSLDSEAQRCARWIFLSLTQLGEGTDDTRRRVLKADLEVAKYSPSLVDRTLHALSAAKLIVINTEELPASRGSLAETEIAPIVTIEVAHEILIRHWSTLRWWLSENRKRLQVQRPIDQCAIDWQKNNRAPDLLLRGMRLAEAEELYVKYTDELTRDTQEFIEASIAARQGEQIALKRRLRRAQQAIVAIASLAIAALGFGSLAAWNQRNAQIREIQAISASSEALLNSNQQLEALTAAIKAGHQLKHLDRPWNFLPTDVKTTTIATLQQAISQTQESHRLTGHAQQVNDVRMSSDGQLIATVSNDGFAKLWSREGALIQDLTHKDRVLAVAFSADNQRIATASADKTIKLWDREGKLLETFNGHRDWVTDVQFSENGRSLVSSSRDGTIKQWQLDSMKEAQTFRGHRGWVNRIAIAGQRIVSGGEDGTVKLWEMGKPNAMRSFNAHKERVTSVMIAPNGRSILTSGDTVAKLWTISGKELVAFEGHQDQVNTASYSPDGRMIVTGSIDRTIRLWNLEGALLKTIQGHGAAILHLSFSPAGTQLLSASADKTARIWQLSALPKLNTGFAAMSTNGTVTAIATSENAIQLDSRILKGHTAPITQLRLTGDTLISTSADKTIRLWNTKTGESIKTLTGHSDRVTALSIHPEGKTFASGSADKTIKIWSIKGNLLKTLLGHKEEVTALNFLPDGRLASGSVDKTIRIWEIDKEASTVLGEHQLAIAALAVKDDTLASASWDNTIQLWSLKEMKSKQTLLGHSSGVTSLSFHDSVLASGSDDGTIRLWDAETGALLKTLIGTKDKVASVAFKGNVLISTSDRVGLTTWNFDLDSLLKQSCDRVQFYIKSQSDTAKLCQ
ncbi:MAG: WD40 repeat domain-containing protein, partial [Leptolyngbya sp. Prado105]|nr:WD40 repeat domain-containing protein [Leptolyngbya sp. Prado105]